MCPRGERPAPGLEALGRALGPRAVAPSDRGRFASQQVRSKEEMDPTFLTVLEALHDANVRYLVVGGVAVVLHGALRATADLDLVVQLDPDNAADAVDALAALGFVPRLPVAMVDFANPDARVRLRARNALVFTVWHPASHRVVDLFLEEPFPFEAAWSRRTELRLGRVRVALVGRADLIGMKQQAGRPKDMLDVTLLRALEGDDGE